MLKTPPKSIRYLGEIDIHPFTLMDAPEVYQTVKDSQSDLNTFMAWAHFKKNPVVALSIYTDLAAKTSSGKEAHYCAFDTKGEDFLFCTGLFPDNRLNPSSLELSYWVSSKHSGKGLGTLASKIMIFLAFQYYHADRVSIRCNLQNKGSEAIIRKCGFQKEGELRNSLAAPTKEMLKDGYSKERSTFYYSLITEDLPKLSWLEPLAKEITLIPFME